MFHSSRFYIRAKGDNSVYWHCNTDGQVTASRTNSTRFLVRTVDQTNPRLIMINADAITIAVGQQAISATTRDGFLQLTRRGDHLSFGDFDKGYAVANEDFVSLYGCNRIIKVDDGSGEPWELSTSGRVGGLKHE